MKKTTHCFSARVGLFSISLFLLLFALFPFNDLSAQQDTCQLNCAAPGQISVDENCEALITAAEILTNEENRCSQGVFFVYVYTDLTKTDTVAQGPDEALVPAGNFGSFVIEIYDSNSGNSCWTTTLIEDKTPPQVVCDTTSISCVEEPTYMADVTDNCDPNPSITILDDSQDPAVPCSDTLLYVLRRTYLVTDAAGNTSTACTQVINVLPIDTDEIDYPADTTLDCTIPIAMINGFPDPAVTGQPTFNGIGLLDDQQPQCNFNISYNDSEIPLTKCTKKRTRKIVRTWVLDQWDCNGVVLPREETIQRIDILDTIPPAVTCPQPISVTAGAHACEALVTLPPADESDLCSPVVKARTVVEGIGFRPTNGGTFMLPVGTHNVTYFISDECDNEASCMTTVTVGDNTPPNVSCNSHMIVSVTSDGSGTLLAESLDDGSNDNCGDVYFKAVRMTVGACNGSNGDDSDATGYQEWFDDKVKFCCEDISDSPIMVRLRVFDVDPGEGPVAPSRMTTGDLVGRWNECMVEVSVQDKLPPSVIPPPDITVSCLFDYDFDDLDGTFGTVVSNEADRDSILIVDPQWNDGDPNPRFWGLDGLGVDNCNVTIEPLSTIDNRADCGTGNFIRRWRVRDDGDRVVTTSQTVTIINNNPFSPLPNAFPRDFETSECNVENLTPDVTGDVDTSNDDECSQVAVDYTDQVYTIVEGACFKILRTWSIIDWCQFDSRTRDPNDQTRFLGRWEHIQVIKVNNTEGPEFTAESCVSPDPVESDDADCSPARVALRVSATDDCTDTDEIVYRYEIDAFNDGSIDIRGAGNDATNNYPVGLHKITWTAEDRCGNKTSCSYTFEVINATRPIMYCKDIITVIGDNGTAEVWAIDVDNGSTHTCDQNLPITLSFSTDTSDQVIFFDCTQLGDNLVRLYATDRFGNQDFCEVTINIQDNERDLCPDDDGLIDVTGTIQIQAGAPVSDVIVNLEGSNFSSATGDEGAYAFEDMPRGGSYAIAPELNINASAGLNTLDLILTQRHILGTTILDGPYNIIAADVDASGQINVLDLLEMQFVILGMRQEFSNNTSWRFINQYQEWSDPQNPLADNIEESYVIDALTGHMKINFTAVKTGDVNQSNRGFTDGVEIRSQETVLLETEDQMYYAGDQAEITLSIADAQQLLGTQLGFTYNNSAVEFVRVTSPVMDLIPENMYVNTEEGDVRFSWYEAVDAVDVQDEFITLVFNVQRDIQASEIFKLSDDFQAEMYDASLNTSSVDIAFRGQIQAEETFTLYQNNPNPFEESTIVGFEIPEASDVILTIYDAAGKTLYSTQRSLNAGYHNIEVHKADIGATGMVYYQLIAGNNSATKKMLIVE